VPLYQMEDNSCSNEHHLSKDNHLDFFPIKSKDWLFYWDWDNFRIKFYHEN